MDIIVTFIVVHAVWNWIFLRYVKNTKARTKESIDIHAATANDLQKVVADLLEMNRVLRERNDELLDRNAELTTYTENLQLMYDNLAKVGEKVVPPTDISLPSTKSQRKIRI